MRRASTYGLLVVAAVLLFASQGTAFGYVEHGTSATVLPGDDVHFTVSVFGIDESVKVTRIDAPKNWRVKVDPDHVNVPPTKDYRYIETGDGYRKITSFTVTATVPISADPGDYDLTLVLAGGATQSTINGSGVTVQQRQDFPFTVTVPGDNKRDEPTKSTEKEGSTTVQSGSSGLTITHPDKNRGDAATPTGEVALDAVDPVVFVLLFELMWGIAIIYVLKRRNYL